MRVLLVEDDAMIGKDLVTALAAAGMSVDWGRDGAQAEAALRNEGYAIVRLDLGLLRADGFEILKSARREGIGTPVLIIVA
jgi:DNA-binding response OmpR family regulator